jgi:hypothetical protein
MDGKEVTRSTRYNKQPNLRVAKQQISRVHTVAEPYGYIFQSSNPSSKGPGEMNWRFQRTVLSTHQSSKGRRCCLVDLWHFSCGKPESSKTRTRNASDSLSLFFTRSCHACRSTGTAAVTVPQPTKQRSLRLCEKGGWWGRERKKEQIPWPMPARWCPRLLGLPPGPCMYPTLQFQLVPPSPPLQKLP